MPPPADGESAGSEQTRGGASEAETPNACMDDAARLAVCDGSVPTVQGDGSCLVSERGQTATMTKLIVVEESQRRHDGQIRYYEGQDDRPLEAGPWRGGFTEGELVGQAPGTAYARG